MKRRKMERNEPRPEEPTPYVQTIDHIYEMMRERQIYAARAFTGKGPFELAHGDPAEEQRLEEEFREQTTGFRNPYLVFEGAHPDHQTVLFKIKIDRPDFRHSGENELLFYQQLAPILNQQRGPESARVKIPELIESGHSEKGFGFIITEFADGDQIGGNLLCADKPLSLEEFRELAHFIRSFSQTFSPEVVRNVAPNIDQNDVGATSTFENHVARFDNNHADLLALVGSEYVEKMQRLLAENQELLTTAPEVFINQDINPANLIRSGSDIYVIDWERLKTVRNPGAAYSHIIESHWQNPELQRAMISEVVALNADIPNFTQLFRLDMIFHKYTAGYFGRVDNPELTEEQRQEAQEAVQALAEFLKEAIDGRGVWQE